MNDFDSISLDNLHHAYLIVGDVDISREKIGEALSKMKIEISGNPDIQSLKYDTLTIDIARDLSLSVAQKDFGGDKKIFIVEADIITEEAQNSLLKVLEEPTPGTHFFIMMPQDILLPTLRSRLQIILLSNPEIKTSKKESILNKSIADRLEIVKEITDGITDEEKTKQDAITLLNQVESELYSRGVEKEAVNLRVCQDTRNALYDRGTPVKMVLENLMLSI